MPRILILSVLLFAAACGSAAMPAGADASAGADAPDEPDAAVSETCPTGDGCELDDGSAGLCAGDACGSCAGPADDAACVSAYGAGHLCLQGACILAACRGPVDCGGQDCVDHQCVGCTSDDDCNLGEACDSATGLCEPSAAQCTAEGQTCGAGDGSLCCTRQTGLECVDVECCDASDCSGSATCEGGICVASGSTCDAPTDGHYYVNPSYTGTSTGSQPCPFKTLHKAFSQVRSDDFTGESIVTITDGATINSTSEGGDDQFPLSVPAWTTVRTLAGAASRATIVAPVDKTAFETSYGVEASNPIGYSVRFRELHIKQATGGGADGSGIKAGSGNATNPISIDHVEIDGFYNGIKVIDSGRVSLGWGVEAHDNTNGLRVDDGRADISVGAAADADTEFYANEDGIDVSVDGVIAATGSDDATGLKRIKARNNQDAGIRIRSDSDSNLLDHVGMNANGTSGLAVYNNVHVVVRSSNMTNNAGSGVRVNVDGDASGVAGIDLGDFPDPGYNTLHDNGAGDVCIEHDLPTNTMQAEGNTWDGIDCTGTPQTIDYGATCAGAGAGVVWESPAQGVFTPPISVATCSL